MASKNWGNKCKPWEEKESDFQSYDIIIFKYPVFNHKHNQKACKERGKYSTLNGTKLIDRNNPPRKPRHQTY